MKPGRIITAVAVAVGLCVVAWLFQAPAAAQKAAEPVTKWEYKVIHWDGQTAGEKALNELGAEGWEVTGATSAVRGGARSETSTSVHVLLKRPKK